MTSPTEPEPNARERLLGAELVTEIFLLGDEVFSSTHELDAAIEKLCVHALARYRAELTEGADGSPGQG